MFPSLNPYINQDLNRYPTLKSNLDPNWDRQRLNRGDLYMSSKTAHYQELQSASTCLWSGETPSSWVAVVLPSPPDGCCALVPEHANADWYFCVNIAFIPYSGEYTCAVHRYNPPERETPARCTTTSLCTHDQTPTSGCWGLSPLRSLHRC